MQQILDPLTPTYMFLYYLGEEKPAIGGMKKLLIRHFP
jgi:hypothetical protein